MPPVTLYRSAIWEDLITQAQASPSRVILRETSGRSMTYTQLVESVDQTAVFFVQQGMRVGDKVMFLAKPTILGIVHFFAVLRVGGIVVIADPGMGAEAFGSRMRLTAPRWVLMDPLLDRIRRFPGIIAFLRKIGSSIPDLRFVEDVAVVRVQSGHDPVRADVNDVALGDDRVAVVVFTSGTTQAPKGVAHSYRSLAETLRIIGSDLAPSRNDVFYASQLYFVFLALLVGATAIIPTRLRVSSKRLYSSLVRFGVTKAFGIPREYEEMIPFLVKHKLKLPEHLRVLLLGSAPVVTGFLGRLSKVIHPTTQVLCVYGSTEILPISRVSLKEKLAYVGEGDVLGKPFEGIRVEQGTDGEFLVSGPNLCDAYLGNSDQLRVFLSGDLGKLDAEGNLVLLGRKKDMIIRKNFNIYPSMFEATISRIKGVKRCAMVGVFSQELSDEIVHLVIEKDSFMDDVLFREYLNKELLYGPHSIDTHAQPDHINFMDIPIAGRSQKPDKNALRKQLTQKPWQG